MWPYISAAPVKDPPTPPHPGYSIEDRRRISTEMETALQELRRSVYLAPNQDVPAETRYDGSNSRAA